MVDNRRAAIASTNEDVKQLYRSLYTLVKQLDEKKQSIKDIKQIFAPEIQQLRLQVVSQSENLLYQSHDVVGKKSREVFWRKGYYELISMTKHLWAKCDDKPENELAALISEGIAKYKSIIVQMEQLNPCDDIRHLIDFAILDVHEKLPEKYLDWNQDYSNNATQYAKETIHSSLLSIGDLHRYSIDFNLKTLNFTKESTAKYYLEAFNLNPKIGMAQNQLGTLFSGRNYDLDSTYHYLYALICQQPFELSENNVSKIFFNASTYVGELEDGKSSESSSIRDFIARFILIADIFFFDKDVTDFTSLCHSWLIDLKALFQSKQHKLTEDMLFKIVNTLFFCMAKLKRTESPKLYSLIALMVAICSEMVDVCIANMERFIEQRQADNEKFQDTYKLLFELFEKDVRRSRDIHKSKLESEHEVLKEVETPKLPTLLKKVPAPQPAKYGSQSSNANELGRISNESSSHEKESDVKSNQNGKSKKKQLTRRRRKKIHSDETPDDSELSSSCDSSDYEMDSNFSSDEEEDAGSWFSSCYSSDNDEDDVKVLSSDEEEPTVNNANILEQTNEKFIEPANNFTSFINPTSEMMVEFATSDIEKLNFQSMDDDADIVIEEEIVYTQCADRNSPPMNHIMNNTKSDLLEAMVNKPTDSSASDPQSDCKFEKLRYKREYSKIDPNIVIEFAQYEQCTKTLKILFDWLKVNNSILLNCFESNPEFIHKILKLLNYFNIDIFTKKVYFERNLIKNPNVRLDLRSLFDIRLSVPLNEDILLKDFDLLRVAQQNLDWTVPIKLHVTPDEENILRVFKLVDFGFFLCKMKKFHYNFCARTRRFIEVAPRKERSGRRNARRNELNNNRRNNVKRRNRGGRRNRRNNNVPLVRSTTPSNDERDVNEEAKIIIPKKGYLKNKNIQQIISDKENSSEESKNEIMGKLWLRNEVKALESIVKKGPINKFTPYLVLDSKSLTEHLSIVKNLIQSKKFVLLVPTSVICELDELKKSGESARNAIRFLEQQFSKGSRFIRSQRNNETLAIPLVKIPKKLDRESATFIQIAHFCNFIQTNHSDNNIKVVTLLTGENLHVKKSSNISFTGILKAVSVDFELITVFHSKYKKK